MPKRINPQDQWETDFLVPLPGEPRNIGPLEVLFQRLLNRTERLKSRLGAILGLPWDAPPPDTLAGLAGRVNMLETSVSADPTPDTIARRNAQGAVQDGATCALHRVVKVNGIYEWSTGDRWVRIVRWGLSPTGYNFRGIFADLHFTQLTTLGLGSRVRVRAYTDGAGVFQDPAISLSQDYLGGNILSGIITNVALVQTGQYAVELWVYSPTKWVYVQGTVATNADSVSVSPYGVISEQATPPSPIPGGLYLEWSWAPIDKTFVGPGNIVAANRNRDSGFIRYDNGIQIAWESHASETFGSVESVGSHRYREKLWTFPAAFASSPIVLITPFTSERVSSASASYLSPVSCVIGVAAYSSASSFDVWYAHSFAIGRWK
jgi:hypothetical protein